MTDPEPAAGPTRLRWILVHGAFRGGWCWDRVAPLVAGPGIEVVTPTLSGMGPSFGPGTGAAGDADTDTDTDTDISLRRVPRLADWVADVVRAAGDDDVAVGLVGHSLGGVVTQAAAGVLGARLVRHILLDTPLVADGQRALDVSSPGPVDESRLPPADTWLSPTPVGPSHGFDDDLADWVNQRLGPTPFAPSLDPVVIPPGSDVPELVFCERTPPFFPSALSRAQCDAAGIEYRTIDTFHDAPLLAPEAVAALINRR